MAQALAKTFRSAAVEIVRSLPKHQQVITVSKFSTTKRQKLNNATTLADQSKLTNLMIEHASRWYCVLQYVCSETKRRMPLWDRYSLFT
jgi:hypothetical protein